MINPPYLLNWSVIADVLIEVLPEPFPGLDFSYANTCTVVNVNGFIL
jgi:hypothetical protein